MRLLCYLSLCCAVFNFTAARPCAAEPSPAALADFDKHLKPFLAQYCDRCHNDKKQEGEFRIDTLARDFGGHSSKHWAEIIERINSGEMPPADEPRAQPEETLRIAEYIAGKLKEGEAARLAARERVGFYKLTREEYGYTIADLLGVQYDYRDPTGFTEDPDYHGFERIGSVLSIAPSHIEKYFAAGESILAEALPVKAPVPFLKKKDAYDLRGANQREELTAAGLIDKVRVELWPGAELSGGRPGPGQALPAAGLYKMRIQLSGLKPKHGRAPHLIVYATDLDRMLFEQDIVTAEFEPTIVEFTAHLPAGNLNIRLGNDVPGPSNLPRSGRADPRIPFYSIKDGRRPWQMKLTDEEGEPIAPFLIVDWVEWSGPLHADEPTLAQREFLPSDPQNKEQIRAALQKFGDRAFRRPFTEAELNKHVALIDSEMSKGEKFDAAYKTALLAILCSKDFLYLVQGAAEPTQPPEQSTQNLNDWELAARLSYFLWSSIPDEPLRAAARAGTLHKPEVLKEQVARMLADPKAARFAESFPRQWLQLKQVGMFAPDKKLYPDYDAFLEKSMIRETLAFFNEVLTRNLSLREFLDSNWTMLNPRLGEYYNIAVDPTDKFHRVALKPDDHRGGLLTQASILSLTSDGTRHRPVHRGKWVLEAMLNKSPPPPPANVKPIEPTPAMSPKATLRMKLDAHKSDANCAACHRKIDPLGLAFDNYDAIGRWRTEEVVSDGEGKNPAVDASGELPDGRKFAGPTEFKKLLCADVDKFNTAFIEKLATYALRRTMTIDDRDALAKIAAASKANDYRLQTVIEALVLSEMFQKR
jgi:hypothetical protein